MKKLANYNHIIMEQSLKCEQHLNEIKAVLKIFKTITFGLLVKKTYKFKRTCMVCGFVEDLSN